MSTVLGPRESVRCGRCGAVQILPAGADPLAWVTAHWVWRVGYGHICRDCHKGMVRRGC